MPTTEPRVRPGPPTGEVSLGTVIDGRYRLDALLGRGGMGVVYRAEHVALRRTVAVKLLHPGLANAAELRSRFEREALAIGRIDHPNCVSVTDFGKLPDGSLFLVMELLDGQSLGDLMASEGPLAPARALAILRQVLAGLGHAHDAGIIHRDVKPENVYLVTGADGTEAAKILDFGIAKVLGGEADEVKLTQAGIAFGTPIYMSPEQAFGNPLDGRSDLYAASVLAFEMLCGRPPFVADDKLELLSMHTSRPPPTMASVLSEVLGRPAGVPPAIEAVVRRGLAKRREDRYATAADYIAAIDAALTAPAHRTTPLPPSDALATTTGSHVLSAAAGEQLEPMPVELTRPGALLAPRRRLVTAVAALAVAILLGVLAATIWRRPAHDATAGGASGSAPLPITAAGRAAAKLQEGKPGAAIKEIQAAPAEAKVDPEAQIQLGLAYAAARRNDLAVAAYRRALELDGERGKDDRVRASLHAIADDTDLKAAAAALTTLVGKLDDAEARTQVVRDAAGPKLERRAAMTALAGELGLGGEVDWLASYQLDLEQPEICKQRKPAVARLRALGDPRAIPALEAALARKGKAGAYRGKAVNECLADDARAAINYLRGLEASR